jgi:CRISPR-associated protein Csb2
MPTLRLRFPGGRYHATPVGHHVNEGLVEWPPSPWRLLRALTACGFTTQHWHEIPPAARSLIEKLASALPSYRLPTVSAAHTRHFMPTGTLDKGRERTTLVFDTWANVGDGELLIRWDCSLTDDETRHLEELAAHLGYLGRSESWVEAELLPAAQKATEEFNSYPCHTDAHPGPDYEQVSLTAAITPSDYAAWRTRVTGKLLAVYPLPEGKRKPSAKLLKDRERAVAPYPESLVACLTRDTSWWKGHHWSQPPGSRRVLYWRRADALELGVPGRPRPRPIEPVTSMLLALTTPSGSRSALPPCSRTLPQAELVHQAVVARVAMGRQTHCPELTGRDERGAPLRDGHRHAHILPVDLDGDGRLDHLVIHAPMGLGAEAQGAVRTLRRTWTKGGAGELQLAVAGHGDIKTLLSLPAPLGRNIERILGGRAGSRVWLSATPFVPPKFLKSRGRNTLEGQIATELASRGLPEFLTIEVLQRESIAFRHFVRARNRGGAPPPIDVGYAIRLSFADLITGPIALGYASHFGLGLFVSASTPTSAAASL